MSSSTAKYVIPYPVSSDVVAGEPTTLQNLASRVDLLLGESGSFTIASLAAGTTHSQPIVLSRTYPGNTAGSPPGIVVVNLRAIVNSQAWTHYLNSWTGSGTTITGFTLNLQFGVISTARVVDWRFFPVL